jgi:hypothetical protein
MDQFLDFYPYQSFFNNSIELSGHIASMYDATSQVSIERPYVFFDLYT